MAEQALPLGDLGGRPRGGTARPVGALATCAVTATAVPRGGAPVGGAGPARRRQGPGHRDRRPVTDFWVCEDTVRAIPMVMACAGYGEDEFTLDRSASPTCARVATTRRRASPTWTKVASSVR